MPKCYKKSKKVKKHFCYIFSVYGMTETILEDFSSLIIPYVLILYAKSMPNVKIKNLFLHKMFQTYGIYIPYVKDLLFYIPFLPLDIPFLLHSICSSNTFSLLENGVCYLSLPYIKTDKLSFFRIQFQCFRQMLSQVSFPLLPLNKGNFQDFCNRIRLS